MTRCELGTVVVVTRAKNSRTKRWRRRETEEGRKGGGGVLKKTERTGIRKKSGALGSRRTVSCSFLRAEQSRRLPRWAGANGKAQAGLSGSGYEYPILQYRLPDAVSLSLCLSVVVSRCASSVTGRLAVQLVELSSRGAVASGQREPARQFVIDSRPDRHPTGPAAPHVALYSPQAGGTARINDASTKTCKQGLLLYACKSVSSGL